MKIVITTLFLLLFSLSIFGQTNDSSSNVDETIATLSVKKKAEITNVLKIILDAVQAYGNSTNPKEISTKCLNATASARKLAKTLSDGFFARTLVSGAGALDKAFMFRYAEKYGFEITPEQRKEIVTVYKLGDIAPEDRADKLFDYAKAFFDIAADVAIASGVNPKAQPSKKIIAPKKPTKANRKN